MHNNKELATIPVILMSAGFRPSLIREGRQFENVEFVAKPFDLNALLDLVDQKLDLDHRAA